MAPVVAGDTPGRFFVLKTPELGSLDRGTPIYFRHLKAGQVVSYELDKNGSSLTVKVFVQAPYDQYVTPNTRFWHASGIDMSLSASGLRIQTESFLSMLIGGLAFETPATARCCRRRRPTPSSRCSATARMPLSRRPTIRSSTCSSSTSRCAGWPSARRSR